MLPKKRKGGRILFYDLGMISDGDGGWLDQPINSSSEIAVLAALNSVLSIDPAEWATTFRPLSAHPGKNNLRVAMDTSGTETFTTTGEVSWSDAITRETINIIGESPLLDTEPVEDIPYYAVTSGLFPHISTGTVGANLKVTSTPDIEDAHTPFTITDTARPVRVYLQNNVFTANAYKLVSDVPYSTTPTGPSPGLWASTLLLRWYTSRVCGSGSGAPAEIQNFSVTSAGEKIEETLNGNLVTWHRHDVFADTTTIDYDPIDPFASQFAANVYTINDLIADYGYIPYRYTETFNSGGSGMWVRIWTGLPAILCDGSGEVILRGSAIGEALGAYFADGDGSYSESNEPISGIDLELGDSANVNSIILADSLVMAINQGDDWYYIWNRNQSGGG